MSTEETAYNRAHDAFVTTVKAATVNGLAAGISAESLAMAAEAAVWEAFGEIPDDQERNA